MGYKITYNFSNTIMKNFKYILFSFIFFAACSTSQKVIVQDETQTESATTSEEVITNEAASKNWHHENFSSSGYYGIGTDLAYSEILANKKPSKKVIVAVIDSGTDIYHEDLSSVIWKNPNETENNNDDDNNGYVDDINGWNFIGGKDGSHMHKDTYEVTRIYKRLMGKYADMDSTEIAQDSEYELFQKVTDEFTEKSTEAKMGVEQFNQISEMFSWAKILVGVESLDSLKAEMIEVSEDDSADLQQAKGMLAYYHGLGVKDEDIDEAVEYYSDQMNYSFNLEFDERHIVGDDYEDLTDRYYGNNDVKGPSSDHGTHVAGIIGADRSNDLGIKGVADNVELMIVRTVPDGDERDKDVANAVRYAVENGADVINMSFGKNYSPEKEYVDQAFKFADENNVLVIHSAGNDGENIDSVISYPNKFFLDGTEAKSFITVGASSWTAEEDSSLAAFFSNYGQTVDLFAPGVDIYSTMPENKYKENSGTSMAGPVVSGAAALIMAYYPEFSAEEIKNILLDSVTKVDNMVFKPGSDEVVPFSSLSATGGIVNVYNALKLAEERANK